MASPCRHSGQSRRAAGIPTGPRTIHRFRLLLLLSIVAAGIGSPEAAEVPGFPPFHPGAERAYLQAAIAAAEGPLGDGAEGCHALARVQSQLGNKEAAERWARRAIELGSPPPEILGFLAELLILQDRMDEAVTCLRQLIAVRPQSPAAHYRLGMALDRLGDREGARRALEVAITQAPGDAAARLVLGRLLLDSGEAAEAAVQLGKACELDPNLAGAFYALAQAQTRLNDLDGSARSLDTFKRLKERERSELDSRNTAYDDARFMRTLAAGFHVEIAGLLARQQQWPGAEAHLRQAIAIAPTESTAYERLGAMLLKAGRLVEARDLYEGRTRSRPDDAAGWLNLGTVRLQLRDPSAGVSALKRALELDPNQPAALNNLARFYLGSRQELPEALALARRLVTVQPSAASYDLLGWALYANGNPDEARGAATRAVELAPTNQVFRERLQRLMTPP